MKEKKLDKWLNVNDIQSACNSGLFHTRLLLQLHQTPKLEKFLIEYHDNIIASLYQTKESLTNKFLLTLFFESAKFLQNGDLKAAELETVLDVFKAYITHVLDILKSNAKAKAGIK